MASFTISFLLSSNETEELVAELDYDSLVILEKYSREAQLEIFDTIREEIGWQETRIDIPELPQKKNLS